MAVVQWLVNLFCSLAYKGWNNYTVTIKGEFATFSLINVQVVSGGKIMNALFCVSLDKSMMH